MIFHDLGVAPPSSANEWALSNYNSKLGSMNRDGWEYYKHGYGCRVVYPGGEVDFDFGKDGEIDGLDLYKVWDFVERSKHDFAVSSIEELKAEFENSTRKGELVHEGYAMYHLKS